jgi:hypothetical protein
MDARDYSLAFSLLGLMVTGCGHPAHRGDDARLKQAEYECYRDSAPGPSVTGSQGGAVGASLQTAANAQRRASYARCMESRGYNRSDKPEAGVPSAPPAPPVARVPPPGPLAPSPSPTSLVEVDLPTRQAWCNSEMKAALGPSLANAAKPLPADLEAQYARFMQACLAHGYEWRSVVEKEMRK